MRRTSIRGFSVLALACASVIMLTATAAQAQLTDALKANIPFRFTAGMATLPPGNYTIRVLDIEDPNELTIAKDDGSLEILVSTVSAQAKQPVKGAELVFTKVGDRDFLSEVWPDETGVGYQVPKTRAEQKLEKGGAKRQSHRLSATHVKKGKP